MSRYCPVCYRPVEPTQNGNIQGHFDTNPTVKNACPAGFAPYFITLTRIRSAHPRQRNPLEVVKFTGKQLLTARQAPICPDFHRISPDL